MPETDVPTSIDRRSSTPLYLQIEQILRSEIERGLLRPGELLPSENEICERFDVSRSVVRQTLQNLAQAGVIHTARGRGSFVAEEKLSERFVQRATGFYEDLTSLGLDIQTAVIRQEVVRTPVEVRRFLGVDEAVRIDRVRSVAGRVLTYVVTYLPAGRVPGLVDEELTDRSLYTVLEDRYQLRVDSGRRTVEAVPATEEVAGHLDVAAGTPSLLLRSMGRTEDGEPLEWFDAWHRADRTRFEVEIARDGSTRPFQQAILASDRVVPSWTTADAAPTRPRVSPSELDDALARDRAVAVVRAPTYGDGAQIARGLAAGGIRVVEFTLTGTNALEAITQAAEVEEVLVGAGSVHTVDQARRAIDAGARFLVSPARVEALVREDLGVPVVLAGYTPTEILEAFELTGGPVKVFPVVTGGLAHLQAIAAPLPDVPLMPSGGIDASNAADFLRAGAIAVNVGSSLCHVPAVVAGDAAELERRARELRHAIDEGLGDEVSR